jgi:flagellar assembly protein FliH
MNTSSNPARAKAESKVVGFPYPEVRGAAQGGASLEGTETPWNAQEEQHQREEAAREAGRHEGDAAVRTQFAAQVEELRLHLAAALDQFSRERREYYLAVERAVVQLALAIARKILRRESSLDPLLLAGMVRVALEKTENNTHVKVHVNPHQVSEFRVFFAGHMLEKAPEVIEDPTVEMDRCVLHTELGSTEIGPEIQLKEIEQGLLDLEAARPQPNPSPSP